MTISDVLVSGLVAQAIINVAAALASISGPLAIGALVKNDVVRGWRKFWVSLHMFLHMHHTMSYKPDNSNSIPYSGSRWQCGQPA